MKEPTIKQEIFAKEFVATGNKTKAAMVAYDCKNKHTASNIGQENMKKPVVQQTIRELKQTLQETAYDELFKGQALQKAIDSALADVALVGKHDSVKARDLGRKFLLEVAKLVMDGGSNTVQHLHLSAPKR